MVAVACSAGHVLFKALRLPQTPRQDTAVLSVALGLGLLVVGTSALGWLGLFQRAWLLAWFGAVAVVALGNAWYQWMHRGRSGISMVLRLPPCRTYPAWMYAGTLIAFALAYLAYAMTPPLEGDTLHSYLDVPRQFLEAGRILPLPYELHSSVPLNVQMLSVLSLGMAGDELAQMLASFTMVMGATAAVYVLGRRFISPEAGLLGAVIFMTMYTVQAMVPSAKTNLGWAFWDLLAVYGIARWGWERPRSKRWLLAAGVFSGLAIGSLYSGSFTALLLGTAVVLALLGRGVAAAVKGAILYAFPAMLLSGGWLLRNWQDTGNPVYPVFNGLLGLPSVELAEYARHSLWGMLKAPWEMSTGYIVGSFGRPVGPLVLGGLPALIVARGLNRRLLAALGFVAIWYVLWYFGVQRPRNMLTILGILSIASATGYLALVQRSRLVKYVLPGFFGAFLLYSFALYARETLTVTRYGRYTLGLENREAYLERNLKPTDAGPTLAMIHAMETLPATARILSLYTGNGYYAPRPFIDSRMVDGDFSQDTAADATSLVKQWHVAGITHVFIAEGYLARAASWGSDLEIVLDSSFADRCLTEIFNDRGQSLYLLRC